LSKSPRSSTFINRAKCAIKVSDPVMEKSLGILFFLRKPRPFRPGPWLAFLRITVDGISKELSLKRTWDKLKWKPNPGRATGKDEQAKALNAFIDIVLAKVYEARRTLVETGKPITAVALRDIVSGAAQRKRSDEILSARILHICRIRSVFSQCAPFLFGSQNHRQRQLCGPAAPLN
jgi:hypothetical protein